MLIFVLIVWTLSVCFSTTNLAEKYPFNATLKEGSYYLYWNFSTSNEKIQFAVRVKTTGWIGFGVSANGQMAGSDVVIGWTNGGTSFFHDRFAFQRELPPIDPVQDWYLTMSVQEDSYTQLEFHRNYITCDQRDREILAETSRIVFSWNDNKPTVIKNSDGTVSYSFERHQQQGSTSINLLGGLPNPPEIPSDANSFIVGVEEVTIPATDTTYYCRGVQLDEEITSNERYIIKISADISAGSEPYVHHVLVYICDGLQEEDLGSGGNCDTEVSYRIKQCLKSLLIAAWAVGGSDFIYPENVAYPIGGPYGNQFAVIQIHYNNPDLVSGVIDSSGLKFIYINTQREHDAGILFSGHTVHRTMAIPPGALNYTVTAFCTHKCTEKYFPSEGIHIFADMLHTHLIGTGLEFSVVEIVNCSSGQTRFEQTQLVERNVNYDFNFQQANHLSKEIIVKPGSTLLLNCFYNSSRRSEMTLGGESTKEEMCLSFPVYYPQIKMTQCTSLPTLSDFGNFILNYVPEDYQQQFKELTHGSSAEEITATFGLLQWNQRQQQGLYNHLYKYGSQYAICYDGGTNFDSFVQYQPNICCVYETGDQCTGITPKPCCQRSCVNTQGGASMLNLSFLLLFLGVSVSTLVMIDMHLAS